MDNKRNSPRQKSFFRGLVYFANSPCATECVVRDLSETGARIKFEVPPAGSVDYLELQIPIKAQSNKCSVIWRTSDEIGLAFLELNAGTEKSLAVDERVSRLEKEVADLKTQVKRLQRNSEVDTTAA